MDAPLLFPALGSTAALLLPDPAQLECARSIFQAEIDAIDKACSRFRSDSDLMRINAADGQPTVVSELFLEALAVALRAARITDGLVDPTIGSAVRKLGYDRDFASIERNGPPLRVSVQRIPGWKTIEVQTPRSIVRVPPGVELDFGATAKALCVDRAAAAIARVTKTAALVGIGGDLAVAESPSGPQWPVFVTDDHASRPEGIGQRIRISSGGLATSGTTVRRWMRGDRVMHHVIDPASGLPAPEKWRTASVTAASCVDANIASTAAIIMGEEAPGWLEARGLPARLVAVDGAVTCVAGWPVDADAPGIERNPAEHVSC